MLRQSMIVRELARHRAVDCSSFTIVHELSAMLKICWGFSVQADHSAHLMAAWGPLARGRRHRALEATLQLAVC